MDTANMKKWATVLGVIAVVAVLTGVLFFNRHNTVVMETVQGEIAANETNSAVWGQFYPAHWDSYQANLNNTAQPSHLEAKPYLQVMYEGIGFAKEYNEPRGHLYAIEDVTSIDPARQKAGASCFTCKSPQVPEMMEKYGAQYYLMSFDEMKGEITESIGCLAVSYTHLRRRRCSIGAVLTRT